MEPNGKNSVWLGVELGDDGADYGSFVPYLEKYYDLAKLGFVLITLNAKPVQNEQFEQWARFFRAHHIRFAFLYSQQRGGVAGEASSLNQESVERIRKIAGEYFIGDMIGELGGSISWPRGYFPEEGGERLITQGLENINALKDEQVAHIRKLVAFDRRLGIQNVLSVEPAAFQKYSLEAGVDIPCLEMMCGDPEELISFTRGAARGYGRQLWGCHIAHEWYGGFRHDDPLKYKRLKLAYAYAYLSGANLIYLESGDKGLRSYGLQCTQDHPYCEEYRRIWTEFANFAGADCRPEKGPLTRVAFVSGNLDAYAGWGNTAGGWSGSTFWNQYQDESWGYNAPEYGWRLLKAVQRRQRWHDVTVYGKHDLSGHPAFGQYDCIPSETPLEIMGAYDMLIFAGWNTMTEELYQKLKAYVERGGKLLMSAAHLNTSASRAGEQAPILDGEVSELFGCRLTGAFRANKGVKFSKDSLVPGILYPGTDTSTCDPICGGGFAEYTSVEILGGHTAAYLCKSFGGDAQDTREAALVEYRCGAGYAALVTSLDYPGALGVFSLYTQIVKEWIHASHRSCPIQVIAPDQVVFSVYTGEEDSFTCYLLNTDYDLAANVEIIYGDLCKKVSLASCELCRVDIPRDRKS